MGNWEDEKTDEELRQQNHDLFHGTGDYEEFPQTDTWKRALEFAKIKQEGRLGEGGISHFEHIKGVMDILTKETDAAFDEILTVAALQSILENTECTCEELEEEFGEEVAQCVNLLTRKKDPLTGIKEPFEVYAKRVFEDEEFEYARSIEAANRLQSLRTLPNTSSPEKMCRYIKETERCILPYENVTDRVLMKKIREEVESLRGREDIKDFFCNEGR